MDVGLPEHFNNSIFYNNLKSLLYLFYECGIKESCDCEVTGEDKNIRLSEEGGRNCRSP
jgi:hypothetical protein